ncbi:MAG: NAD(P)/FAD-dependent oxidoreductase [Planctomycetota bacterium]
MPASPDDSLPHVVIIGGGFAGLEAARRLRKERVRITLLDKRNHHLFQPLLYQVAMAGLAGPDIAAPIRTILRKQRNVTVLMHQVLGVDLAARKVRLADSDLRYDYLVVAAGARTFYFGKREWKQHARGLKTIEDALRLRTRILMAFEIAETEKDPEKRRDWLTFAVIGGGPTGVEMAGAIAEMSDRTMERNFRNIDPSTARVILVEGQDRVLGGFPEELSAKAQTQLEELGVEMRLGRFVKSVGDDGVQLEDEFIPARTVIWAAGVRAQDLTETMSVELDRQKRIRVGPDLRIPGHDTAFAVGDIAHFEQGGQALPGVAPVALQQGRHAAQAIRDLLRGRTPKPFRYLDKGSMATIGRSRAVAVTGQGRRWPSGGKGWRTSGFLAWITWVFVHVYFLVGFRNRFIVLMEWARAYFSWQRSARVIHETRENLPRFAELPQAPDLPVLREDELD